MLNSVYFANALQGWAVGNYSGSYIILYTADGGTSWSMQKIDSYGLSYQLSSVHFANASSGWAVGDEGLIMHTSNGGSTWITQVSGTTARLESVYFTNAFNGWAVGYGGTMLHTSDGGSTWTTQTSGTSEVLESICLTNDTTGWAIGWSGLILHTTNALTGSIASNILRKDPNPSFHLYPNPTNGKVNIDFTDSYKEVNISVSDITGRIISTRQIDTNHLEQDIEGPPGIYILSIQTESKEISHMRVIKQ
jgi:photosystem II stability/assembly factor-like uncharacterized protein